jgi:hypothetical protein
VTGLEDEETEEMSGNDALPAQAPSVPGGDDLNWRTVWPGQWTCDNAGYIWADSLKGGKTHMIDVRGWGYLTGRGMGALALDNITASRLQDELGALLCAAPDLLEALKEARINWHHMIGLSSPAEHHRINERMSAAIAKATAANSVGTPQGVNQKGLQ